MCEPDAAVGDGHRRSAAGPEAERFGSHGVDVPVVLVPGLAVARYLRPVARAFADVGHPTSLLRPPGWPGRPSGGHTALYDHPARFVAVVHSAIGCCRRAMERDR
jgi:hypothetical protein